MSPADETPIPELTPEEKAKVYAHFARQFTPEKLISFLENDERTFPAEQVLADIEAIERGDCRPAAGAA